MILRVLENIICNMDLNQNTKWMLVSKNRAWFVCCFKILVAIASFRNWQVIYKLKLIHLRNYGLDIIVGWYWHLFGKKVNDFMHESNVWWNLILTIVIHILSIFFHIPMLTKIHKYFNYVFIILFYCLSV